MNIFQRAFESSIDTKLKVISEGFEALNNIADQIADAFQNNNILFIAGNGGSAADAQHLAAEFLIRYRSNVDRIPLPAISLSLDSSTMTACGNDYSFDIHFSRALSAMGNSNDVLLVLSTSGNSKNIILALNEAKKKNITTLALLGGDGGEAAKLADHSFIVPSDSTANIQESHIVACHSIVEYVENKLFKE